MGTHPQREENLEPVTFVLSHTSKGPTLQQQKVQLLISHAHTHTHLIPMIAIHKIISVTTKLKKAQFQVRHHWPRIRNVCHTFGYQLMVFVLDKCHTKGKYTEVNSHCQ